MDNMKKSFMAAAMSIVMLLAGCGQAETAENTETEAVTEMTENTNLSS